MEESKKQKISIEELDKIKKALEHEEFRKLLLEYCEEIADPKNLQLLENEIKEMEESLGKQSVFIHPKEGYVIEGTLQGKNDKYFINVCSCDKIEKATSWKSIQDNVSGTTWSIPHSISPERIECYENKTCKVFDIVFHPETLSNEIFRELITETCISDLETNFNIKLNKNSISFPRIKFKGKIRPTIIRKHENEYIEPKYEIKYKNEIDWKNYTNDNRLRQSSITIPDELIILIKLPLLDSIVNCNLDITDKTLLLCNSIKPKYKLQMNLPYKVLNDEGKAQFLKEESILKIELPVNKLANVISKIPKFTCNTLNEKTVILIIQTKNIKSFTMNHELFVWSCKFMDSNSSYSLSMSFENELINDSKTSCLNKDVAIVHIIFEDKIPLKYSYGLNPDSLHHVKYICELDNIITEQEDVDEKESLPRFEIMEEKRDESETIIRIKSLEENGVKEEGVKNLEENSDDLKKDITKNQSKEMGDTVEELNNNIKDKNKINRNKNKNNRKINGNENGHNKSSKNGYNESSENGHNESSEWKTDYFSADTFEKQTSPVYVKGRSILKKSRSFSESSMDDFSCERNVRSFSVDDVQYSYEEDNNHNSIKKTVTFNDVICKKMYSCKVSIIAQEKKTRRRNLKKERKASASESDNSEAEIDHDRMTESIMNYNKEYSSDTSATETSCDSSCSDTEQQSSSFSNFKLINKREKLPSSKKGHKKRGKKSVRKSASTAKHNNNNYGE